MNGREKPDRMSREFKKKRKVGGKNNLNYSQASDLLILSRLLAYSMLCIE